MLAYTDITEKYTVNEYLTKSVMEYGLSKVVTNPENLDAEITELSGDIGPDGNVIAISGNALSTFKVGDIFSVGNDTDKQFRITEIKLSNFTSAGNTETFTNLAYEGVKNINDTVTQSIGSKITILNRTQSATAEVPYNDSENFDASYDAAEHTVENYAVFDEVKSSLPFINENAKLKFFARTPGTDGNNISIAIANPIDFGRTITQQNDSKDTVGGPRYVAKGISLDDQFDATLEENEFAVCVLYNGAVVETYVVSFDESAKNDKNEFTFIETQINAKSSYILVAVNDALPDTIRSSVIYTKTLPTGLQTTVDTTVQLTNGTFSEAGMDDIELAYDTLSNKEEIDIDIVIGNELHQKAAINLAVNRADCIAFIGAPRSVSVGLKASVANTNTIDYRKSLNVDSKYVTLSNNYKYQYCSELGGNRWINCAGDIAGIKAASNFNNYTWYAAAGLNRGNVKNVEKLAYSPNQSQRDQLYKNGINPVVIFPNTGAVLWGQKTLQTKASSFDRVNVVALFNYLERSLARMSKYSLFEFNDEFQRNYIVSLIKPFLAQVKSGRGITDYLVICDTSNNTSQVIANNQMVIDIYIKPNYSAEYIYLRFTNVGTNDFSIVTGTA